MLSKLALATGCVEDEGMMSVLRCCTRTTTRSLPRHVSLGAARPRRLLVGLLLASMIGVETIAVKCVLPWHSILFLPSVLSVP